MRELSSLLELLAGKTKTKGDARLSVARVCLYSRLICFFLVAYWNGCFYQSFAGWAKSLATPAKLIQHIM